MAKRKAVMKNIIYELDDIEISSDEEVSGPKVSRPEPQIETKVQETVSDIGLNGVEVLCVDSTDDSISLLDSPRGTVNGGKTDNALVNTDSPILSKTADNSFQDEIEIICDGERHLDGKGATILNEDIIVDSPSDALCTVGCENRLPLVTVKFNNSKLLSSCRDKIKRFMIQLIKEHRQDAVDSDDDLDYELDIWPDDLVDENADLECIEESKQNDEEEQQDVDENLFFVDTAPCDNTQLFADIPMYRQVSSTISNEPERESSPTRMFRRSQTCFNCDGDHQLRECPRPRDNARIAQKRQNKTRVGRYHVEDDQKYGHLIPGRISGPLRHALGLKRDELPLYTYRMRLLGYPPGWLEEARISHSGITLFDSTGSATLDPEEEEGEICEAGSKDKYDIKKILDFPGFNVPASSRYKEEGYLYGLPPMSEQDSKIAMLQKLAPNAMKAYKRKKLTFFPSASNNSPHAGQAEMELDSGDEDTLFPTVPPLPDEAPPPLPPPPEQPPPPPEQPPPPPKQPLPPPEQSPSPTEQPPPPPEQPPPPPEQPPPLEQPQPPSEDSPIPKDPEPIEIDDETTTDNKADLDKTNSDIEIVVSQESFITIDEDIDSEKSDERSSPSLELLEKKKQDLLKALHNSSTPNDEAIVDKESDNNEQKTDIQEDYDKTENEEDISEKKEVDEMNMENTLPSDAQIDEDKNVTNNECVIVDESIKTPDPKAGHVKTTSYGTPILNIASPYVKLPSDDKFAKDICDIINFENLPNSVGKYKKISKLLKKVKNEVDRIQES